MKLNLVIIGGICLAAGFAIGHLSMKPEVVRWTNGMKNKQDQQSKAQSALSRETVVQQKLSEQEIATLQSLSGLEAPQKDGALIVVPAALIEQTQRQRSTRSLQQDLFGRDGELEQQLQITDREKASIQRAWRALKRQISDIERTSAKVKDAPNGAVHITIPDLAENAASATNAFRWKTSDILGENRAEAFLAIKQFDSISKGLAGEQTYHIEMDPIGDGKWRYRIIHKRDDKQQNVVVTRSIPHKLRHITGAFGIPAELDKLAEESEE